ncbi:uncharacterized protein BJX67DRAFT_292595 [Aspergillus lucknowensis]|uniref:Ankyrin repeat-containing domain protein n=1 Tax=Aspergillus lucknowensis TaxID=176173 RepID=A0ABR4LDK3_9EURO
MITGGGRDSLKVYGGSLPGDTIPIYETEDNNDKEATAATTMTISQRRQRQNQLVELLLSGRREDGPVRKQEVLAAAGEYNAERVTVDLLVRDHHNHGNSNARHVLCIHAVLRTYHLATVVRLLRGLGDSLSVSEEIVMAAAENQHSGRGIVKFLLDNRWDEVRITEDVVRAAARNSGSGKQILELLLERGERLTWVSEDALRAAREEVAR